MTSPPPAPPPPQAPFRQPLHLGSPLEHNNSLRRMDVDQYSRNGDMIDNGDMFDNPHSVKRQRLDHNGSAGNIAYPDYAPLGRENECQDRGEYNVLAMNIYNEDPMIGGGVRRGVEMAVMRKQMETMKKEISALKKENSDLRATNDFLLDKVTTLGASKLNGHASTSASSLTSASLAQPSLAVAGQSTIPSLSASLSAAAAQVTHATHSLTIGPPLSMALPRTIAHPTIAAPPSIAPSIAQPSEGPVQAGVQHPLSNPLSITSISTDGSVGSVVAIAAPPQPPPPTQPPPPPPPPQPLAPPPQAVAVAAAPPTAAVVVSVGTVQVPLSQAAITITSGTVNPRITSTSMAMSLPSIVPPAPAIVPSIGQTIAGAPPGPAVAAANIAQAISLSQGAQAISMSQGAPPISMSQVPPISMTAPQAIAISGPQPMSISGAAASQLLSYPIMSQPALRTQLH